MINETTIRAGIRKVEGGKATVELRDSGGRGEGRLVLVIRTIGERAMPEWYAVWYRAGRRKMAKLGTYGTDEAMMSLAKARKLFRKDYAPAISAGRDPASPRKRKEAAAASASVKDLFEAYVASLRAAEKPSADFAEHILLGTQPKPQDERRVSDRTLKRRKNRPPAKARRLVAGAAQTIGETKQASEVTAADIRKHLASIHQRGAIVKARDARGYLHAAFAYGLQSANDYTSKVGLVDWGLVHNPVSAVPTDKSDEAHKVGQRHLAPSEVRTFWVWLSTDTESAVAAVPQLMIATGQRVTEILRVSVASDDTAEDIIDWSKTKNGLPHAIPVPSQGREIISSLTPNSHGLYFPHLLRPAEPASIDAVEKVVKRFLKAHPDIPHFTPRDLRRTWKTLSGAAGISKEHRDRLQNHARADVSSRHYDRYDYLVEKRAAMATWSAYLDRILSGDLDNPVARLEVAQA